MIKIKLHEIVIMLHMRKNYINNKVMYKQIYTLFIRSINSRILNSFLFIRKYSR